MKNRNWIIINCINNRALYGFENKTLRFSSDKIAQEVGEQFFGKEGDFIVFNIDQIKR